MNKLTVRRIKLNTMFLFLVLVIAFQQAIAQGQQPLKPAQVLPLENARAVAWNPSGDVLAVGADDGIYLLSDRLKVIRVISNPVQQIESLGWSPDGHSIAASSIDKWPTSAVRVWNVDTSVLITTFSGQSHAISSVAWSPDGSQIASGSSDETLKIWDAFTAAILHTFSSQPDKNYDNVIEQIAWSPDGARIAAYTSVHGIRIWDVQSETLVLSIPEPNFYPLTMAAVAWSPDGQYLLDGYGLRDVATGKTVRLFHTCPNSFMLDWHPSSQFAAIYSGADEQDEDVYVCNVRTDTVIARLDGGMNLDIVPFAAYRNALDWNPDGKRLAGAAGDGFVRIWEVPIPQQ